MCETIFRCIFFILNFQILLTVSLNQTQIERHLLQTNYYNSTSFGESWRLIGEKLNNRDRRNVFTTKQDTTLKFKVESKERPAFNNTQHAQPRPRFNLSKIPALPVEPHLYRCQEKYSSHCQNMTNLFRDKILTEFKKSLTDTASVETNYYNVEYGQQKNGLSSVPVACMILNAKVKTLRRKDLPFNEKYLNELGRFFPKSRLFSRRKADTKSCAIISSAGALLKSKLGHFIDLHDIVMRFNHAPVKAYEVDVGKKTTIRVVNSQVVSKPEFDFIGSALFENISIAAWDPGKFNGSIADWIASPDFNIFENYKKYMTKWPNADVHLVDPRSIWTLWKVLQQFSNTTIRWNPPSSGFIGLALLLPICSYVDVIEYMPSTRLNGLCHYYDDEINPACTFGAWHPLAAEKLMAYEMNSADANSVFQNGVIRIRRPDKNICLTKNKL